MRANHSANSKRGGVCKYYKNCLPLKVLDIIFLRESITFDSRIDYKLWSFITLYHGTIIRTMYIVICNNMQENLLLYARLSLQVVCC